MWYVGIDFYLLKPLMKLFINAGVLSDLGPAVYYPKKPALSSILKPPVNNEIGPRFTKRGPNGLYGLTGGLGAGAI